MNVSRQDIVTLCNELSLKPVGIIPEVVMESETIVVMSGDKKIHTCFKELRVWVLEKMFTTA